MIELSATQCEETSGGLIAVLSVLTFMSMGGYRAAVDFTSGAIEGFAEAGA